jgi:hypothetical protein
MVWVSKAFPVKARIKCSGGSPHTQAGQDSAPQAYISHSAKGVALAAFQHLVDIGVACRMIIVDVSRKPVDVKKHVVETLTCSRAVRLSF